MASRILDASGNEVIVTFELETDSKWKGKQMAWMNMEWVPSEQQKQAHLTSRILQIVLGRDGTKYTKILSKLSGMATKGEIDTVLSVLVAARKVFKWTEDGDALFFIRKDQLADADMQQSMRPSIEFQVFELTKAMLEAENRAIRLESEEKSKIKEAQDLLAAAQALELEAGKSRKEELKLKRQIADLVKKEAR